MERERFRRRSERSLVYGHRGASAHETENSTLAVERARRDGADGVEIDVRLARCGSVVVFHDDTLERLSSRSERVDQLDLAELQSVELEGGASISTLEEILEAAAPMLVNVEIKTPGPTRAGDVTERVLMALRRLGRVKDRVLISSFDPTILLRIARRDRGLCLGLLFHHQQALPLRRAWLAPVVGAVAVHPFEGMITRSRMSSFKRAERLVNTWTVDDPGRARELDELGVDGIISNDPGATLAALTRSV